MYAYNIVSLCSDLHKYDTSAIEKNCLATSAICLARLAVGAVLSDHPRLAKLMLLLG